MKAYSTLAALAGLVRGSLTRISSLLVLSSVIALALDEVAFPVTWKLAVLYLGQAHVDAEHVRDLAAPVLTPAARYALAVGVAQAGDQVLRSSWA